MANQKSDTKKSGNQPAKQNTSTDLAIIKKDIVDVVGQKINEYVAGGQLHLPENYSPDNAIKSAWLILQSTETKDGKPALKHCTRDSIANALLNMVVQGLNPAKKQGYFIAYGDKLEFQRSYFGTAAIAMRILKCRAPYAEVVYEADEFEYEIRGNRKVVTRHVQKLENIDPKKIKAAYCVIEFPDHRPDYTEIMTMEQIRKSWQMSKANPSSENSTHNKYPDQMAKRTVINRACKLLINSTADSDLLIEHFNKADQVAAEQEMVEAATQEANQELVDVEGFDAWNQQQEWQHPEEPEEGQPTEPPQEQGTIPTGGNERGPGF